MLSFADAAMLVRGYGIPDLDRCAGIAGRNKATSYDAPCSLSLRERVGVRVVQAPGISPVRHPSPNPLPQGEGFRKAISLHMR